MNITVVIEIPRRTNVKYEFDRKQNCFVLDRVLHGSNVYPQNYGFIPKTLDYDGDELDVLVISEQAIALGVRVPTRIIGLMHMLDDGETDTKLLGVVATDPRYNQITTLEELAPGIKNEIQDFFENYKHLQRKTVAIRGFAGTKEAQKELLACQELHRQYAALPKAEFVAKMQELHPEKFR